VDFITRLPGRWKNDYKTFNLFTGSLHTSRSNEVRPVDQNKTGPFLQHIREVICGEDEKLYQYVLCWMAHIVQYPDKLGIMSLLRSIKGAGKSIFWNDFFGERILGKHLATTCHLEKALG